MSLSLNWRRTNQLGFGPAHHRSTFLQKWFKWLIDRLVIQIFRTKLLNEKLITNLTGKAWKRTDKHTCHALTVWMEILFRQTIKHTCHALTVWVEILFRQTIKHTCHALTVWVEILFRQTIKHTCHALTVWMEILFRQTIKHTCHALTVWMEILFRQTCNQTYMSRSDCVNGNPV